MTIIEIFELIPVVVLMVWFGRVLARHIGWFWTIVAFLLVFSLAIGQAMIMEAHQDGGFNFTPGLDYR